MADDAPVIRRIKLVVSYIASMANKSTGVPPLVSKIVAEMLGDLSDVPPEIVAFYTKQVSALLYWVASGEAMDELPLPEGFETEV